MIILRMLQESDCIGMLEWINDPEINQYFRFDSSSFNHKKVLEFIKESEDLAKAGVCYHFAVADEKDNGYLGTISLKNIDKEAKSGEYAISLRKRAQGQGIAFEATNALLKTAFVTLNLNRVYLNVLSDNSKAIRFYERYGFIYEGEFRDHISVKGSVHSLKWYSILHSDYNRLCSLPASPEDWRSK